jgi:peptidoglycan/xylan/chitin deacetylase (PgdA/CDA1 family)
LVSKVRKGRVYISTILVLLGLGLASLGAVHPAGAAADPVTIWAGKPSRHEVALTFDDGPSPVYTREIMALLKQYQAKATFFVIGSKVERHPELIKALVQGGHEVGNHTFDHCRLTRAPQPVRELELERTRVDLDLLGCPQECRLVRPPYSDFDNRLVSYARHTNRKLVLWSVDSGDWRGLDAEAIAYNVISQVKNGSIVIFHDSDEESRADRRPTVEALKIILPALTAVGYRLVTISELARPRP